jgi:hypothetical protein
MLKVPGFSVLEAMPFLSEKGAKYGLLSCRTLVGGALVFFFFRFIYFLFWWFDSNHNYLDLFTRGRKTQTLNRVQKNHPLY